MSHLAKKLIMFDLDGTLAVSKQALDKEMSELIKKLLDNYMVAIISGGALPQFQKQILDRLDLTTKEKNNLILMPTTSANIYMYHDGELKNIFSDILSDEEKEKITENLKKTINHFHLRPKKSYGKLIEDRDTQISYSALGQLAPPSVKATWDPKGSKRIKVIKYLKKLIPNFSEKSGGMTTIDITHPGMDKAHGVHKAMQILNLRLHEIVFVGDALYLGGNDYPAKTTGVDCVEVKDVEDTKKYIESIL